MKYIALINVFECIDKAISMASKIPTDENDVDGQGIASDIQENLTEVAANIELELNEHEQDLLAEGLYARWRKVENATYN